MTTAPTPGMTYDPPMRTLKELRAALAGLATLGLPTELDRFEAELAETPLDQVPALAERFREYIRRNTTPEAIAALTMPVPETIAILQRKMAGTR